MKGLFLSADWEPKKDYKITEWEINNKKAITASCVWRNSEFSLKEVEKPKVGDKDLLINVKSCGICGTDTHLIEHDDEGYVLYPGLIHLPIILGHEFSGIIIDKGKEVKDFDIGDYVVAEEMVWCGECIPCRNGFPNQCTRLEEIGITINGAMAKYISVPAKLCWKINDFKQIYSDMDLLFDAGALVEPTSVAHNAIFERGGGIRPGERVVVFGAGPVGLLGIMLLKIAGASKVIVFETNEERLKIVEEIGADVVYNPIKIEEKGLDIESLIMKETKNEGADFILETSGAPNIILPIILNKNVLNVNSKLILIGRSASSMPLSLESLQTRASQIYGAQGHSGNGTFPNVIRLIESGKISPTKIITSRFDIEEAKDAFNLAKKRKGAKIMFRF